MRKRETSEEYFDKRVVNIAFHHEGWNNARNHLIDFGKCWKNRFPSRSGEKYIIK